MTGIFRLHDSIRVTPSIPIPAETSIPAGKSVFQRKLLIISLFPFYEEALLSCRNNRTQSLFNYSGFGIPQSNLEFVIFRQFKKT